jgi:hypothetical protein
MVKWNEVLRISKAMGGQARFSAGDSLAHTWWARK